MTGQSTPEIRDGSKYSTILFIKYLSSINSQPFFTIVLKFPLWFYYKLTKLSTKLLSFLERKPFSMYSD